MFAAAVLTLWDFSARIHLTHKAEILYNHSEDIVRVVTMIRRPALKSLDLLISMLKCRVCLRSVSSISEMTG